MDLWLKVRNRCVDQQTAKTGSKPARNKGVCEFLLYNGLMVSIMLRFKLIVTLIHNPPHLPELPLLTVAVRLSSASG